MMWLVECPLWDQGLVRPLLTEAGDIVLMCDSCTTVWCGPDDVESESYSQPAGPDWDTGCGSHVKPGTTKWADMDDVRKAGWGELEWHAG
ncbi:hypothetical protein SAMN05216266_1299 [Amycolatopsis marina]|uniref:Uncharacterized protein n=1 Tax=Amycolatopsis marina TaxID=490629 RepID=A0A1I1CH74_9PSEU|nr:hypothetical protein SAMN05216266_1299 [Amycolatopsis marina]